MSQNGNSLELEDVRKTFPEPSGEGQFVVLDDVTFEVPEGSFTTIMGPSGCGKSTILNIISGILPAESGTIRLNGEQVEPGSFSFGYVFQDPRLLNWRTVRQNLKFALNAHDVPEEEHDERIHGWLDKVGLAGEEQNYPLRLSGGMRQRIGLTRAMVLNPDILLMDEPFSALDEVTARKLRRDLLDIWSEERKKVLFVTHDISEAVFLSDQILFMNDEGVIFKRAEIDVPR
ncbi:MAG: ABC transporter ATP-binding protein, partial [Halobacteriales archaeon]|nr:ABC transporter ATP-binding protein [Halobacteriales archaeon]